MILNTRTVKSPSTIASGIWVNANTLKNLTKAAINPELPGKAAASCPAVVIYVKKSDNEAAKKTENQTGAPTFFDSLNIK